MPPFFNLIVTLSHNDFYSFVSTMFFLTIIGALYQQSFIFNLVLKGVWIFGSST